MNGLKIKNLIATGYKVKAITTSDKKYTKSIIQYRLIKDNSFYFITKYQAIKYLSNDTIEYINFHKKLIDILNGSFNKKVELNIKMNDIKTNHLTDKNSILYLTMLNVIKNKEYSEL